MYLQFDQLSTKVLKVTLSKHSTDGVCHSSTYV
jgi:hypothetical protein